MAKTEQALRITAYWSPDAEAADEMMASAFEGSAVAPMEVYGGVLHLRHHILVDFSDPAYTARVSERIAVIKSSLEAAGALTSFTTTAVAVPKGTAQDLHDPEPETDGGAAADDAPKAPVDMNDNQQVAEALAAGWLPEGWRLDPIRPGAVIVPDDTTFPAGKKRSASALYNAFSFITGEGGAVLKG